MQTATSLSELHEQIRVSHSSLSKRLQQVAEYVLENTNSIAFDTVAVIAEKASVPPSTLIRFASAFGFSGFNQMKQLFRQSLVQETTNYPERVKLYKQLEGTTPLAATPKQLLEQFSLANAQAMEQLANQTTDEQMERAVELLSNADTIYLVGLRRSFSVASYLAYAFSHLNKRAILIDGLGGMFKEQLNMVSRNDVVLAISFSPYAEETLSLCKSAAQAGARQITITDSLLSPLASLSEVCFVVKEAKVDAFRSQSASLCLAQSLAVAMAHQPDAN
ncbi:MurR/RpiR family transcriptional regulator [Vibrio sp. CAU 1672]|uniref:MurR/RpiR family transcriptional regulator n=1 Tax=Vibrio sp. CAU 1672 TaxID=3032594 RepID=UPI0023DC7213|nr:MurR/RpiR family transcriptional regulator [Vibrio sp. CAU 1672]MDF2153529.1 MurR/RpiR family transcriptional regulator [Vibrio sp. CAU 1672]